MVRLRVLDIAMAPSAGVMVIPNVSTKLHHYLWLALRNQIRNDLPFIVANVHEILLGPRVFVNGFQHSPRRTSDLSYGRMTVYEV